MNTVPATFATGVEKFIVETWESWDEHGVLSFQFYDCKMNDTFCDLVDFPYDRTELFDVYICLETLKVQVSKVDSEEYFTVDIIGMNFQKS
mgnify:CR=1 FL=1